MSATLKVEDLSRYFGGCPVVEVPGRTHPVTEKFLEDVIGEPIESLLFCRVHS